MKTAKEMFEELGYELVFDEEDGKYYKKKNKRIEITKGHSDVYIDVYYYKNEDKVYAFIDGKELQAINQMVSELGWFDD